jgi:chemotaxis family two-component system sensor histidine kinase/response regulator PixL
MAINPEIRDQAYQFFIEEAPELLQIIEAGLLTLRQEKNTAKVHALMRAAHSLKGGAASVELEAIKTLAHRQETIFKALYNDTIAIDTDLESQLLQAYDCLRLPLMEQFQTGYFDAEQALALAEPIFVQIESRLGDALTQADTYIPSSSELGIDMARSIFEVDVGEGLERLAAVVANPQEYEVAGELRAQAEVFAGFAELLNQPGFGAIAQTALAALDAHPERALAITQLALADFEFARQAVLASPTQGTKAQKLSPSAALFALAHSTATKAPDFIAISATETMANTLVSVKDTEETLPSLEDVFSMECDDSPPVDEVPEDTQNVVPDGALEEIFADAPEFLDERPSATEVIDDTQNFEPDAALEEIFGNAPASLDESDADTEVIDDTQNFESDEALEKIFANAPELLDESPAEVAEGTQAFVGGPALEENFANAAKLLDEPLSVAEVLEDTREFVPEEALEENFANAAKLLDEPLSVAEVTEDTRAFVPEAALEEIFANVLELLDEPLSVAEVTEDTREYVPEEALEEIFANVPELLDKPLPVAEVPQDTRAFVPEESLEEIFADAPELLNEPAAATEVSEDTQGVEAEGALAENELQVSELNVESSNQEPSNLQPSNLQPSNLQPSNLQTFNLQPSNLQTFNLQPSNLQPSNLQPSNLQPSNLQPSNLQPSNLQPSNPQTFNLQPSNLQPSNPQTFNLQPSNLQPSNLQPSSLENLEGVVESIAQIFDKLPPVQEMLVPTSVSNLASTTTANLLPGSLVPAQPIPGELFKTSPANSLTDSPGGERDRVSADIPQGKASPVPNFSVRVDSNRLERMNNVVGELAINRNGLSLQNQHLQRAVRELLERFVQVQNVVGQLRELSDQMLVAPERNNSGTILPAVHQLGELVTRQADFDALELDRYGTLNSRLQGLIEDMVQLEESVDDVALFAKQSNRTLEQQRQMLTQLRDEIMWARMLPLSEVLNRFPRVLRDLSTTYHKLVSLNLSGAGVLVDKGALEKLYDPLLHLLRNAFDHGIESPEIRRQQGKPEQGKIEIRAYHQGSQTIIEVKDDGQGLDVECIGRRAIEMGFLSADGLRSTPNNQLFEFLFEPGFSTAKQVSELSGRGVGLDVVRSQMRSLKGSITVTSSPGAGTTFTLRLPLTLTIAKLLVCLIGPTAIALPSDSVEEIVVPKANQVKTTGEQRFLRWRGQIVPTYRLADLLDYTCPLPESSPSKALVSVPSPADWALPMLILRQEQQVLALEIDRLVTEQELVIKPFGSAIAPPSFTYGCTILGDGSLIPVIDGTVLLDQLLGHSTTATRINTGSKPIILNSSENASISQTKTGISAPQAPTVLVVDDAAALRRTLAITLERAGCQVLQARDGREALEQLRQGSSQVNLVVCDIEMPNMNGFEFLGQRRQDSQLSNIPVVMLTSRSNDKHRWLAMRLGATAYFTKPYLEQEFLAALKHIIDEKKSEPIIEPSQNQPQLQAG